MPLAEVVPASAVGACDIVLPPPAECLYTLPRQKSGPNNEEDSCISTEKVKRTKRSFAGEPTTLRTVRFNTEKCLESAKKSDESIV